MNKKLSGYIVRIFNNFELDLSAGSVIMLHGDVLYTSDPSTSTTPLNVFNFHVVDMADAKYHDNNW